MNGLTDSPVLVADGGTMEVVGMLVLIVIGILLLEAESIFVDVRRLLVSFQALSFFIDISSNETGGFYGLTKESPSSLV